MYADTLIDRELEVCGGCVALAARPGFCLEGDAFGPLRTARAGSTREAMETCQGSQA